MMEETLKCFLEAIEAQSREEIQALSGSVASQHQDEETAVRSSVKQETERFLQTELAQVRSAGSLAIAARRVENRRRLLECRQACAQEAMEAVREKLREYTQGPDYPARLWVLFEQGVSALDAGTNPVTVYLRREDMGQAEFLEKKAKGLRLTAAEGGFALGGLIVEVPALGRRADLTFDTALRKAQSRFGEIAGL